MVNFTVVDQLSFDWLHSPCVRQVPGRYDSTFGDHCCRQWQDSPCLGQKFGLTVLKRCWSCLIGFRNFGLGNWRLVCSLYVSAVAPVLCVSHLYHITPVGNLSSTGSWTPRVLTGKCHAYCLPRRDGLHWLGSSVVIVFAPASARVSPPVSWWGFRRLSAIGNRVWCPKRHCAGLVPIPSVGVLIEKYIFL